VRPRRVSSVSVCSTSARVQECANRRACTCARAHARTCTRAHPRAPIRRLSVPLTVPPAEETAEGFTREQLRVITRALFDTRRAEKDADALRVAEDEGFAALRALAAQQYRQLCSSSCTTHGVLVRCTSVFVPQKERGRDSYLFSYRVTIHNTLSNTVAVKLLGRQWEILDATGVCV